MFVVAHDLLSKKKVKWDNRFMNSRGKTCYCTVDGTDCPINEPKPFNRRWYSHKFHGPGLRYEIAVCIQTGWIVWVNGPFRCGEFSDIKIFREALKDMLLPGEKVEADDGYKGEPNYIRRPMNAVSESDKRAKQNARARHETINSQIKGFKCLSTSFRHALSKHAFFFSAVVVCVQVSIMLGEKPWQVRY